MKSSFLEQIHEIAGKALEVVKNNVGHVFYDIDTVTDWADSVILDTELDTNQDLIPIKVKDGYIVFILKTFQESIDEDENRTKLEFTHYVNFNDIPDYVICQLADWIKNRE